MLAYDSKNPAFAGFLLYFTSIPIERAVPSMMRSAASGEAAERSGIFCVEISRTCALVSEAIFLGPGF